ncbi:MAG TPA: NADPH-dependent FMN reductase [Burkholderiaceae bacterium]|nr:NADPH-dependent FMN reductase [Burkholderiaceae bacterium]
MASRDVAVLVGSLRKDSLNRKLANALQPLAPASLALSLVEIGALPLYNADLEADAPAPWRAFRERIRRADAYLFVTPEYNRSVPGALKNAIDVGSRPYGQSSWAGGKAGAIISVSPGMIGAFGANHHLRQSLVFLNVLPLQQPEAYVGGADKFFEGDKLVNPATREFLAKYLQAFADWIERLAPG